MMTNEELIEELKLRLAEKEDQQKLLQEQSEELTLANKRLAESEQLKSHFISNITNEIVNPFASILGLSKSIMSVDKTNHDKIHNMAELIHSEAFELDFQLNNIFTAARIEAGEAQPEFIKTDVHHLISSVINNYRYKAEQKQLHVKFVFDHDSAVSEGTFFVTDPQKLKLIVSNLMSNGIKYSNAANRVEITVGLENKELHISVKDYGIGLAKKDLEVIFDRFKRLDSSIHSLNPGHGLGLSVTKALLDSLDGTIDIKSKQGMGSVFTAIIPEGEEMPDEGFAIDGNEFMFGDEDGVF